MKLHVEELGSGPSVMLVHGSITGGVVWEQQRPLAERWRLRIPDRPGFGRSPDVPRVDFERDAKLIAGLLEDGEHLVGHSYGGLVSLLAAARRPAAVRSLTVIEPPAFSVARGEPEVDAYIARFEDYIRNSPREPVSMLRGFFELTGVPAEPLDPLPQELQRGVDLLLRGERLPAEAEIPLDVLARAPFPKLVVSGGEHPVFERV
jgi:pimeloyl-ACP methyl ester carboxylesterase